MSCNRIRLDFDQHFCCLVLFLSFLLGLLVVAFVVCYSIDIHTIFSLYVSLILAPASGLSKDMLRSTIGASFSLSVSCLQNTLDQAEGLGKLPSSFAIQWLYRYVVVVACWEIVFVLLLVLVFAAFLCSYQYSKACYFEQIGHWMHCLFTLDSFSFWSSTSLLEGFFCLALTLLSTLNFSSCFL